MRSAVTAYALPARSSSTSNPDGCRGTDSLALPAYAGGAAAFWSGSISALRLSRIRKNRTIGRVVRAYAEPLANHRHPLLGKRRGMALLHGRQYERRAR